MRANVMAVVYTPKSQKNFSLNAKGEEGMTRKEAKRELRPIKDMDSEIRSIELEIERLMAVATKMTTNYDGNKVTGTPKNKIEEAVVKLEEYRGRLSRMLLKSLDYRNMCLNKIEKIEPASLRKILLIYYFQDKTIEQTAEEIDRSVRWTYEMYSSALDEYAKFM